jgi:hypothetical protein
MRFIIGFLVSIGLFILAFSLIFSSLHSNATTVGRPLMDYANTNTIVEMIIDGPINANQSHYEIQMTVGTNLSQLSLQQGYQEVAVESASYANNSSSYAEFLNALSLAGFSKGNINPKANSNPSGYCATGKRYTYKIISGTGSTIENFWSTSCGSQGTFGGNPLEVKNLFIAQMPDYAKFIGGSDLF